MNENWLFVLLGIVIFQVIKVVARAINRGVIEYRKKKFLKLVNVQFPDNSTITFISADSSDKRSLDKLKRQICQYYEIPVEEQIVNDFDGVYRRVPLQE